MPPLMTPLLMPLSVAANPLEALWKLVYQILDFTIYFLVMLVPQAAVQVGFQLACTDIIVRIYDEEVRTIPECHTHESFEWEIEVS